MKKSVLNILSILFVGIYMFSTMGYAVHECSRQGTVNTVILFNDTPCKCAENKAAENESCCSCCCAKKKAQAEESGECKDKCCTTEVYTITHDQVNSQTLYADAPAISDIVLDLSNQWFSDDSIVKGAFLGKFFSTGFIKSRLLISSLPFISQFRI